MQQTNEETIMVTLTFLIIAYAIRKRFLPEDATRADRVLYYVFSVCFTPLIGPWFYKILAETEPAKPNETSSGVFPNMNLF